MAIDDFAATVAALGRLRAEMAAGVHAVTVEHTQLLQTAVKRHAAQPRTNPRPRGARLEGPRLLTGGYNRSINRRTEGRGAMVVGTVGTSDVRALALEFGNANAFGRGVRTLPYPHFGPGFDEVAPRYVAALRAVPGVAALSTSDLRSGRRPK